MDVPFGNWAPDQQALAPGLMMQADGVQPLADGYGPFPQQTIPGSATALATAPRGMFSYQTADGSWQLIAGQDTGVQTMAADYSWSAIDTGLSPTSGDDFCFQRFGTKLLYTDTTDGLRAYDVEVGGSAVAVAAAQNPRWLFECGNILFGLDTIDNGGNRDNKLIRSSAFSDHTNWTTAGADYQPLEAGDALIWGGKLTDTSALVLQKRAVRLIQVGSAGSSLWGIQSLSEEFGAVGAKSCVGFDGAVYWPATDGFRRYSTAGIEKIGAGYVDQWFLDRVDQSDLSLIQGCIDPFRKNVLWRYKQSANSSSSIFEDVIGFNWQFNKWFSLTIETTYLGFAAQPALTWDAAVGTWDSQTITWDSRLIQGGQPLFGAVNAGLKFGYFAGSPMQATLETGLSDSGMAQLITRATPIDDSPDGTLELGVRNTLSDATTWKTGMAKQPSGRAPLRGRGKYVAFRRNIDARSVWTFAKGVDHIEARPGGPK